MKPASDLHARVVDQKTLSNGFLRLTRYTFEIERHEGGTQTMVREVMERGHAVAVLGYDPRRDEVVLINEFRPGCLVAGESGYSDSVCAGVIDEGESAIDAAVREMKEETGLALSRPILVHPGAFVSPGGTSEKIAIVVGEVDASRAHGVHGKVEEAEDIRVVTLSAETFLSRVRSGAINDLKTLFAGYWLGEHRAELRRV
jgi:ADP-ribose pyrophosphatase